MRIDKKIILGMFFLIGVLLMISFSSAGIYTRSIPQYYSPSLGFGPGGTLMGAEFSREMCEKGQDFIIQIAPLGCTPAIVRSDLLEDGPVPVFCQLAATKINPLIDVEGIRRIRFSGEYPKEVSGIGFHSARAALGVPERINTPILDNIGYVVIMLKQQKNESALTNCEPGDFGSEICWVQGNLTAEIKYDVKNAFGVGQASYYLPELSDEEWEDRYIQYGFWKGRGFLRAEAIDQDSAVISIHSGESIRVASISPGEQRYELRPIANVNLKEGQLSQKIFLPGFNFCMGNFQLKLNGLEAPDTRAKLKVNEDIVEVAEMERFLDNKCYIIRDGIEKQGIIEKVRIRCEEDERPRPFELEINPKIKLSIDGEEKEFSVGDVLYKTGDGKKSAYLGYVSTKKDSKKKEDLYVRFLAMPQHKDKLDEDELSLMKRYDSYFTQSKLGIGVISGAADLIKFGFGKIETLLRWIVQGKSFNTISYESAIQNVFGKQVQVIGFAEPVDVEIIETEKLFKNYYENAIEDYDSIIESFSQERYPEDADTMLSEEALYAKIGLVNSIGQKRTVMELCREFEERYPNSEKDLNICYEEHKLASPETTVKDVLINNIVKTISFEGIYEPTFEEYGATVMVRYPDGKVMSFDMRKNQKIDLNISRGEYMQLIELDEDFARIKVYLAPESLFETITKEFVSDTKTLRKDIAESFGSKYAFSLTEINLKRAAHVSVVPNIDYAGTEADFSFKIGVEKRAISLAPDKIKERVENLNTQIDKWQDISDNLGSVVKGLKTACLGVGAGLTIKNFFANAGGRGIARHMIMRGEDGWKEICTDLVNTGKYISQEQCYLNNSDLIDAGVEKIYRALQEVNENISKIEKKYTEKKFLSDDVVNTDKFMGEYPKQVQNFLRDVLGEEFEDKDELIELLSNESWKNKNYDITQLRDMELCAKLLNDPELGDMAEKRLNSLFLDIKKTSRDYTERVSWARDLEAVASQIAFLEVGKDAKQLPYEGLTKEREPIQPVYTSDGRKYIVFLDDSAGIDRLPIARDEDDNLRIYDESGTTRIPAENIPIELTKVYFRRYDRSSYENEYKNPLVRYYETSPHVGLPAIVPFDLNNGWYAATKTTLPVFGNIRSFDASGRVNSFYLCNVGKDGLEEFYSGIGDDICEMVNLGTGQPYNEFPWLDESEAFALVNKAVRAIRDASRRHSTGIKKVMITGVPRAIDVGPPAVDIPDIQCQDFMSPKDCNILFNFCDPVICPSSRCNFGGAYHVRDVIQSGIIGSALLCLPNFREGIYVPVCLTGIKAGLDGFLSVEKSYRDCLQNNLETGQTIGICDEIHSVYLCEFFWRQGVPLAKIVIPKVIGAILGQNLRGGGEYLGVADAWSKAENSIEYFTQYYAEDSFRAFKIRSTEEVGGAVCNAFVSARYPKGTNFIDILTEPDSPPQFHGRFDEISFTTVTSPPISHYKVFYHIYAGLDSGAYYRVYLRAGPGGSFYQDTSAIRMVAAGYAPRGEYASDTPDFTAPSGYKQMCINVNGREECGFKQVSTSLALDYIEDLYLTEQTKETEITKEAECISGSASLYSLLNPNLQASAQELADPALYNKGIIRICATDNPGKGRDAHADAEGSRWVDVGYCGNTKIRCWLDTESVKDVIDTPDIMKYLTEGEIATLEEAAVGEVSQNYMDILMNRDDYIDQENFRNKLAEIDEAKAQKKINLINEILENVFFNYQKAYLFFLRGNAYADLALGVYEGVKDVEDGEEPPTADKEGFVYPIFEFQDGTSNNNLYYRYFNEEWHWSFDPEREEWESVAKADVGLPSPEAIDLGAGTFERLEKYEANISKLSARYGIDKNIVKAIIVQESRAESDVTDKRGSYGLMQVSEIAAKDVKQYYTGEEYDEMYERFVEDINEKPYETYLNIHLGIAYYKKLLDHYGKNNSAEDLKKITLAAYNWGPTNIDNICDGNRWRNCEGIPPSVSQYVSNVVSYENFFIVYPSPKASTRLFEKDKDFIGELTGKSYKDGLGLLIQRTTADEEGGWFFNPKLSTEKVEMSSKGRFTIKLKGESNLYIEWDFEYDSWAWTYREEARNPELIEVLNGKGFDEGAEILFALNFKEGIETPISAEEEEEAEEEAEEEEEEPTPPADVSKEFEVFPKEKEVEKSAEFKIVTEYPYEFEWRAISTGDVSRRGVVEKGEGKTFDVSELESITAVTLDIYELKKTLFFFTNKISRGHFSWRIVEEEPEIELQVKKAGEPIVGERLRLEAEPVQLQIPEEPADTIRIQVPLTFETVVPGSIGVTITKCVEEPVEVCALLEETFPDSGEFELKPPTEEDSVRIEIDQSQLLDIADTTITVQAVVDTTTGLTGAAQISQVADTLVFTDQDGERMAGLEITVIDTTTGEVTAVTDSTGRVRLEEPVLEEILGEEPIQGEDVQERIQDVINNPSITKIEGGGYYCALYVTDTFDYVFGKGRSYLIGVRGGAWDFPSNIRVLDGARIYNRFEEKKFTDFDSLVVGDVFGLKKYYTGAPLRRALREWLSPAENEAKATGENYTHAGLYLGKINGKHYVAHQIGDYTYAHDLDYFLNTFAEGSWSIETVLRPNQENLYISPENYIEKHGLSPVEYTVKAGDTLGTISSEFIRDIQYKNAIMWIIVSEKGTDKLRIGRTLNTYELPFNFEKSELARALGYLDRLGWTLREIKAWDEAIDRAFDKADLKTSSENYAIVLTILDRESTFNENPKLEMKEVCENILDDYDHPDSTRKTRWACRRYKEEAENIHTEKDYVNSVFQKGGLLTLGYGKKLGSVGPMQLTIVNALNIADKEGKDISEEEMYDILFTKKGGVEYGVKFLKQMIENYAPITDENLQFIFADYNAGLFKSRNAALQKQINEIISTEGHDIEPLELDGYLGEQTKETIEEIFKIDVNMEKGQAYIKYSDEKRFEERERGLYQLIKTRYTRATGDQNPEYAIVPEIKISGAKYGEVVLTSNWYVNKAKIAFDIYCNTMQTCEVT